MNYTKYTLIGLLILFTFFLKTPEEKVERLIKSSVKIICLNSDGNTYIGSGVILNKRGDVLTAKHNVESCKNISVMFSDFTYLFTLSRETLSKNIVMSDRVDLAVIKSNRIKFGTRNFVSIRKGPLKLGSEITLVGYSVRIHPMVTKGIISVLKNTTGWTDAILIRGNSGGGVFNAGMLVGINTQIIAIHQFDNVTQNMGVFIRLEEIIKFLKENNIKYY